MRVSFIRLWRFACSACWFFCYNIQLYCLNDQVTQNRDARIHFLHENIIIYFSISRSIDRNKTSTKLDQLDVCTSYCALHFDSITNKYSAPWIKFNPIQSIQCIPIQSDRKGKSFRFLFRSFYAYLIFVSILLLQTRKKLYVCVFCWLDQHE